MKMKALVRLTSFATLTLALAGCGNEINTIEHKPIANEVIDIENNFDINQETTTKPTNVSKKEEKVRSVFNENFVNNFFEKADYTALYESVYDVNKSAKDVTTKEFTYGFEGVPKNSDYVIKYESVNSVFSVAYKDGTYTKVDQNGEELIKVENEGNKDVAEAEFNQNMKIVEDLQKEFLELAKNGNYFFVDDYYEELFELISYKKENSQLIKYRAFIINGEIMNLSKQIYIEKYGFKRSWHVISM